MHSWFETIILAIIQGITEFLPVSSDGHLALFQILSSGHTAPVESTGADSLFFDIMLHVGTALAIVISYRRVIFQAVRGLMGATDVPESFQRASLFRLAVFVFVALLPLVPLALFLKKQIEATFTSLYFVGFGFFITSCVLILTTRVKGGEKTLATMTWLDALLIGTAQAFAPLPGVSRSGLTIAAALMRGFSRNWAVGFSLLLAVPTILAAAVFEFRKLSAGSLTSDQITRILVGAALAGVVGYGAILWLVRVVQARKLWYFSVYLFLLAAIVLGVLAPRANVNNAPSPATPSLDVGKRLDVDRRPTRARTSRDSSTSLIVDRPAPLAPRSPRAPRPSSIARSNMARSLDRRS